MIVLWGLMEDGPLSSVWRCLEQMRVAATFIDQRRVPEYVFEAQNGELTTGRILGPDSALDTEAVQSIYLRPYNFADLDIFSGVNASSEIWQRAARFEQSMLTWCELTESVVVNRPASMGSNSSKPYQLEIIRHAGFRVPETLITTDPASVIAFREKHGEVIYKSTSSWRSIVSRLTERDLPRLGTVACCPTQFQRFIEGTDYRVHVVNESVFVHRIDCVDDDYRYSRGTHIEPAQLDGGLEERCINLARKLGLVFAGIDLRQSRDGEWYCFEVNPSPGFSYFDQNAGTISLALARHLAC
jgi:glutathione synthase/RimK-type ligase-like ATP-grasp enzyme